MKKEEKFQIFQFLVLNLIKQVMYFLNKFNKKIPLIKNLCTSYCNKLKTQIIITSSSFD